MKAALGVCEGYLGVCCRWHGREAVAGRSEMPRGGINIISEQCQSHIEYFSVERSKS
jgi:hypothetical protein